MVGAKPRPSTLNELLALTPGDLGQVDIARANLLCAGRLPGSETLDVEAFVTLLDRWASHAQREIERNYHRFREDPAYFYNSEAFYKMLMLSVVVYEDFGVRYNPALISSPTDQPRNNHFFANSKDVFIHGMLNGEHLGTCSSMPVLYIALGRRLGYPLKLVATRQHLFMRWDGAGERFDMDATGKGLDKYDDDHYKNWPFRVTEEEAKAEGWLKSLSASEELSVFLSIRGACLTEVGRLSEARDSFLAAYRLTPGWRSSQFLLVQAEQRQRRVLLQGTMKTRASDFRANSREPDPYRQILATQSGFPGSTIGNDPNALTQIQNQTRSP